MKKKFYSLFLVFIMCISTILFSACTTSGSNNGLLDKLLNGKDLENTTLEDLTNEDIPPAEDIGDLYKDAVVFYDLTAGGLLHDNITNKKMSFENLLKREIQTFSLEVTYLLTKIYGKELNDNTSLKNFDQNTSNILDESLIMDYTFNSTNNYFRTSDVVLLDDDHEKISGNHSLSGCNSCVFPKNICSYALSEFLTDVEDITTYFKNPASTDIIIVEVYDPTEKKEIDITESGEVNYFQVLKGYYKSSSSKVGEDEPTKTVFKIDIETINTWKVKTVNDIYTEMLSVIGKSLCGQSDFNTVLKNIDHLGFTAKDIKRIKENILKDIIDEESIGYSGEYNKKYYNEIVSIIVDFVSKRGTQVKLSGDSTEDEFIFTKLPRLGMKMVDIDLLLTNEVMEEDLDLSIWDLLTMKDYESYLKEQMGKVDVDNLEDLMSDDFYKPVFNYDLNIRGVLLMPELSDKYSSDYEGVGIGSYNIILRNDSGGGEVTVSFTVNSDNNNIVDNENITSSKMVDMNNYESGIEKLTFERESKIDGGEFDVQDYYKQKSGDDKKIIKNYDDNGYPPENAIAGKSLTDTTAQNQCMKVWNRFLGIEEVEGSEYTTTTKLLNSNNYVLSMFNCSNSNTKLTLMYYRLSLY